MPHFIYNDGSSSHRGVWHWAPEVNIFEFPEKVEEKRDRVIDFRISVKRAEMVEGQEYYDPAIKDYYTQEQIERYYPLVYPILGYSTSTLTTPAHKTYRGIAACGSGIFTGSNLKSINTYKQRTSKKNIGKHLDLMAGKIGIFNYVEGDIPPQPFCGNCEKQLMRGK